mgnify:CR=1 FL=1
MKILVVDDEKLLVKGIKFNLENDGYQVVTGADGMEAVELAAGGDIDLIILDLMMPRMDGLEACAKIREFSDVPIIMLSARGEEYDKIYGFRMGIDDYVVKPFSPKELMLRIQAVLKRCAPPEVAKKKEVYQCGGLTVDFTARVVCVDEEPVTMSPKEYDLLFYMVRNRGIALTREKLINEVWGYDYYGDLRAVDVTVRRLREKLEDNPAEPKYLMTKRGAGYYLQL